MPHLYGIQFTYASSVCRPQISIPKKKVSSNSFYGNDVSTGNTSNNRSSVTGNSRANNSEFAVQLNEIDSFERRLQENLAIPNDMRDSRWVTEEEEAT